MTMDQESPEDFIRRSIFKRIERLPKVAGCPGVRKVCLPELGPPKFSWGNTDFGDIQVKISLNPTGRWGEYHVPESVLREAMLKVKTDSAVEALKEEALRAIKRAGELWEKSFLEKLENRR
jgi:hypothetical protein